MHTNYNYFSQWNGIFILYYSFLIEKGKFHIFVGYNNVVIYIGTMKWLNKANEYWSHVVIIGFCRQYLKLIPGKFQVCNTLLLTGNTMFDDWVLGCVPPVLLRLCVFDQCLSLSTTPNPPALVPITLFSASSWLTAPLSPAYNSRCPCVLIFPSGISDKNKTKCSKSVFLTYLPVI